MACPREWAGQTWIRWTGTTSRLHCERHAWTRRRTGQPLADDGGLRQYQSRYNLGNVLEHGSLQLGVACFGASHIDVEAASQQQLNAPLHASSERDLGSEFGGVDEPELDVFSLKQLAREGDVPQPEVAGVHERLSKVAGRQREQHTAAWMQDFIPNHRVLHSVPTPAQLVCKKSVSGV
eukprot:2896616-Rhodomonas_salina.1